MNERPTLKMISIPTFRVKYLDLEAFIKTIYGFDCDVLYIAGVTHGMIPEYIVNGVVPDHLKGLSSRLNMGKPIKNLCLILNDLAAEGHIPKGNYLLDTHKEEDDTEVYRVLLMETQNPDSPECVEFKRRRAKNETLQERFAILDREMKQALSRARR
jgi:hypothetical protein